MKHRTLMITIPATEYDAATRDLDALADAVIGVDETGKSGRPGKRSKLVRALLAASARDFEGVVAALKGIIMAEQQLWWLVFGDEFGDFYAKSFDHEPTNEDTEAAWTTSYSQIGETVRATTEAEAIEKAEAVSLAEAY